MAVAVVEIAGCLDSASVLAYHQVYFGTEPSDLDQDSDALEVVTFVETEAPSCSRETVDLAESFPILIEISLASFL